MVTLERMLFDYNEYFHHLGILAEDYYVDSYTFMTSMALALIFTLLYIHHVHPIVVDKVMNKKVSETTGTYILIGVGLSLIIYLYIEYSYNFLLILMLITIALYIIFTDKRLIRVREFILRFF